LLKYIYKEKAMSINHIVVTTESFHNHDKYAIISSNIEYITKLFQENLKEDKISKEALYSYYVDYYLSHILHGDYADFIEGFSNRPKTLYYIRAGLEALGATKHLKLFNKAFPLGEKTRKITTQTLNYKFKKIEKVENLIQLNHDWLIVHPQLLIMNTDYIDLKVQEHVKKYKEDKRYVKIVKQLCEIIEEDFIAITAGDENNIFNKAWHFKTVQGFYYMIEKNNIVTLYNSFTKEEITQGRLVANKTEKSMVSEFISQMMA